MENNNQLTMYANYIMSSTSAGVASPAAPEPAFLPPHQGLAYLPSPPGPMNYIMSLMSAGIAPSAAPGPSYLRAMPEPANYIMPLRSAEVAHGSAYLPPPSEPYYLPPPSGPTYLPPQPAPVYNLSPPPGYHFRPTDVELLKYYLAKKVNNEPIPISEISSVDIYKHHPQELGETYPQLGEKVWYFFTPRFRRYPNGKRPSRRTEAGKWKTTGKDIEIKDHNRVLGFKRVLVYIDQEQKTDWIMHEYRLDKPHRAINGDKDMRLDDWVLCRIYHKKKKKVDQLQQQGNNESLESAITETAAENQDNMINGGDVQMRQLHVNNSDIRINGANYGINDQTTYINLMTNEFANDDFLDAMLN